MVGGRSLIISFISGQADNRQPLEQVALLLHSSSFLSALLDTVNRRNMSGTEIFAAVRLRLVDLDRNHDMTCSIAEHSNAYKTNMTPSIIPRFLPYRIIQETRTRSMSRAEFESAIPAADSPKT